MRYLSVAYVCFFAFAFVFACWFVLIFQMYKCVDIYIYTYMRSTLVGQGMANSNVSHLTSCFVSECCIPRMNEL